MSDDLIVKYLLKEATAEEAGRVESWIREKPEHARHYQDFKTIWEESRRLASASSVDVDAAWRTFQGRVAAERAPRRIAFPGRIALRLAAGLALLLAGSLLWLRLEQGPEMMIVRSGATPITDTLPDGSIVTLNKDAELRYPKRFDGDSRPVALNGEAFFEVAPDDKMPFIISAHEARVRVVGTSFNVKSGADATEVIVATGVVEVSRERESLRLLPRESTTVYKGRAGLRKRATDDALYNYYHTKEFVCNNTPLSRLADILSEAYDVAIEIPEPRLRDMELTVTFRNESLPEVLRVISETLNIRAQQQDGRVIFSSR